MGGYPAEGTAKAAAREIKPRMYTDFVEWIDRSPKTTRTYLTNLRQFAAWLAYRGIRAPARADVLAYRDWLLAEHDAIELAPELPGGWGYRLDRAGDVLRIQCRPNTAAAYLKTVRQFFRWTASEGIYPDIAANVHAPKISQDTHRKEALTAGDVLAIEESIQEASGRALEAARSSDKDRKRKMQRADEQGRRLYAIYLLAVNAGLRAVEIHRANVKDFTTKGGQAWIYIHGKGHVEADVKKALAPEVAEAIRDYLDSRVDKPTGSSPLFVATGNRSGGKRIAATTISTMLKQAMQEAGFDDERITAHSLRHTAGTAVMQMTGNLYATQNYMRHANPATTEIYLHTDVEKEDTMIAARLYAYYHGGEGAGDALESFLQLLNPGQLQRLASMAASA